MTIVESRWETMMSETFGGLRSGPAPRGSARVTGTLSGADLGDLRVFEVRGTPQSLRRSRVSVLAAPTDPVKVCIQRSGRTIVHQGDAEVRLDPGEMTLYDTARPYALLLTGSWRCTVMTIPRDALNLPWSVVSGGMGRAIPALRGPASVLTHLIDDGLRAPADPGPSVLDGFGSAAGLRLLEGVLAAGRDGAGPGRGDDRDRDRAVVRAWILEHARSPRLSHDDVARAHHLSPRSLHRLFETAERTVTQMIRDARLAGVRADLGDPRHDHLTVMALAHPWGFTDQAHLTRAFRTAFGTTPAEYRRQVARERHLPVLAGPVNHCGGECQHGHTAD